MTDLILCPKCQIQLIKNGFEYDCNNCGLIFAERDGILDLTYKEYEQSFFPDETFARLYRSEEKNFWFRVRNKIIRNTIDKYLKSDSRILEVGCGTGFVSSYLKKNGYNIECADLHLNALKFCKQREAGEYYYRINLMDSIFKDEFDAICAFDVIEHIDDDIEVLKNLNEALKSDGMLFITVPANMRLWSQKDISAEHKRRYSGKELQNKLEQNGFEIVKLSYFMTLLFPLILFSRNIQFKRVKTDKKKVDALIVNELQPNNILNTIMFYVFSLEVPLLGTINFPFGSSLLCVAVKKA